MENQELKLQVKKYSQLFKFELILASLYVISVLIVIIFSYLIPCYDDRCILLLFPLLITPWMSLLIGIVGLVLGIINLVKKNNIVRLQIMLSIFLIATPVLNYYFLHYFPFK